MTDRKSISTSTEAFEVAAEAKDAHGLTWNEFLLEASKALDDEMKGSDSLTPGEIADIGAEVERRFEKTSRVA